MNAKTQILASDALTIVMALLPTVDKIFGTHIVSAQWYAWVIGILGAAGIHGTIRGNGQ